MIDPPRRGYVYIARALRRLGPLWLLLLPAIVFAQAPGRINSVPSPQTAGVVGTVIDARTKAPLRGVRVMIGGSRLQAGLGGWISERDGGPLDEPRSILTAADGRFAFPDLPQGTYKVMATLDGWLPAAYGAIEPGDGGRPLHVNPGTHADVAISLWPIPTIEGVVRDANGEPIVGARVEFLRSSVHEGRRSLGAVTSAESDDRGRFKAELFNGTYYLRVTASEALRVRTDPTTRKRVTYGFRPTLYPSAETITEAEPIVLAAGDRRQGVEIRLPLRPFVRLSGVLRRPVGISEMPGQVLLDSRDPSNVRYGAPVDRVGRFVFPRVLPGEYLLSGDASSLRMRANVIVPPEDSEVSMNLQSRPMVTIRGYAEFHGDNVPSTQSFTLNLEGTDATRSVEVQMGRRFTFEVPSATYLATAGPSVTFTLPADLGAPPVRGSRQQVEPRDYRRFEEAQEWLLEEAWAGGHNLVVEPTPLSADVGDLRLVLSRQDTRLDARVSGLGDSFEPTTLVLIPEDRQARESSTYGWSEMTGAAGDTAFKRRVRPGSYFIAAVRGDFPYREAAMLDGLLPLATHITIRSGDTTRVELRAVDSPALPTVPPAVSTVENIETVRAVASPAPEALRPGAVIAGRVIEAGTGRPIPDVRVSTSPWPSKDDAYSDDQGRFVLTGISAGQYLLHAKKPSWGSTALGTMGPSGTGVEITVNPNEQIDGLTLPMIRSAAIEVIVLDPDGRPLAGEANVYQYRWLSGGRQPEPLPLTVRGGSAPNDRRRLSGLPPGDYIVSVYPNTPSEVEENVPTTSRGDLERASGGTSRQAATPPSERRRSYAPVFYPGTRDAASAQLVHVAAGEERVLTMQADPVPIVSVKGIIRPWTGDAATYRVEAYPLDPANRELYDVSDPGDISDSGEFTFSDLRPGRYHVTATRFDENARDDAAIALSTEIIVDGNDQDGVVLNLLPGGSVSGRLLIDGKPPTMELIPSITFRAQPEFDTGHRPPEVGAQVMPDGRFTLTRVPQGLVRIVVEREREELFVSSQRVGGRETIDTGFLVDSGRHVDGVELRVTSNPASVSGLVRDAAGRPVSNTSVVLFPSEPGGRATSTRIFGVRPDQRGRYTIKDVPFGRYLIASATDLAPNDWFNPVVLQRLESAAVPIVIDRERVEMDLRTERR